MAIIFNIGETVKLSCFNILIEPIQMMLENEVEAFEKNSLISKLFRMNTTDRYEENFRSRTAMGGFKPTEDLEPAHISDFGEGYRKTFRTQIWTNSFVVSKQTFEDNQMMDINDQAVGFIKSYGRTRERYGFAMISGALTGSCTFEGRSFDCRGFDTVDGSVDGNGTPQLFFHNAHVGAGNTALTQSNKFYVHSAGGTGINLNTAGAHEKILRVIGKVQTAMQNYTDDKGNPILVDPDTIVMATNNYALKDTVLTALKTQYTSAMGENGVNLQYGNWNVIMTPYLNGLTGFAEKDQALLIMDSKRNKESVGFMWYDRTPLEVTTYTDNGNKAMIWDGRARFGAGFGDFKVCSYVCTGAEPVYAGYSENATEIDEYLG